MSQGQNSADRLEQQVRTACRELGRRLRAGDECRAEEFLAQFPEVGSEPELAMELIYTEYVVREELGQTVSDPAAWVERFPQWRDELLQVLEVHDQVCQSDSQRLRHTSEYSLTDAVRPERRTPVSTKLTPGRQIGNYELLEEIGRGGMGVVYRARQTNLNRLVALKMILSGEYASPRELERFRIEAESAARVQHPNIVQVFEVGTHDLHPFLAMELATGGNLESAFRASRLAPVDAARLVETIARAVAVAHQQGVVHRDLKPANILRMADGTPKVADFGLAKQVDRGAANYTGTGTIVGTPSYMAPEQARGKPTELGPATDIYSLGAILYEALCGAPPFSADTSLETLRQVVGEEPVPPSRRAPGVPRDLETICLKCLEKSPQNRFTSATELADELSRFLRHEPIRSRSVGQVERVLKWARRRPVAALFLASLLASVVVVSSLWLTAEQRRRDAIEAAIRAERARIGAAQSHQQALREQERAEHSLYLHRVGQAYANWQWKQIGRSQQLLEECPPSRRRWEWSFLHQLCHMDQQTLPGHSEEVVDVAFSPDGRWIASGSGPWGVRHRGEVIVWEAATGKPRTVFKRHDGPITSIDFSPDGQRIISASIGWQGVKSAGVKIWSLDGEELVNFATPCDNARVVRFSPDGRLVLVGSVDGATRLCDSTTGEFLFEFPKQTYMISDAAFSPDGKLIATAGRDGNVRIWNLETRSLFTEPFTGYQDVRHIAFSADGRYLAFSVWGTSAYVWELTAPRTAIKHYTYLVDVIHGLAFSPEGRRLGLAAKDGTVLIIAVEDGQVLKRIHGHSGGVRDLAFSPDGRTLVTGGLDRLVKTWDARTDSHDDLFSLAKHADIGDIHHLTITPDGKRLLLPGGYDSGWPGRGSKSLVVWNLDESHVEKQINGHTDWLNAAAVSPDGQWYASASDDKTARLWDARSGKEVARFTQSASVTHVAFHPRGHLLATATSDGEVSLWDVKLKERLRQLPTQPTAVVAVEFDRAGEWLMTAGEDGVIRAWNPDTGDELRRLVGHTARVTALAFSHDGKSLASASADETIRLWDLQRDTPARIFRGHTGGVVDVDFSMDDQRLATISQDQNVKIWDVQFQEEALNIPLPSYGTAVRFHPDQKRLIAVYDDWVKVLSSEPLPTETLTTRFEMANIEWHERAGRKCRAQGLDFALQNHLAGLMRVETTDETTRLRQVFALSELGAFRPPLNDWIASSPQFDPRNALSIRSRALWALYLDDQGEYHAACRRYLATTNDQSIASLLMDAVWIASLAPSDGYDRGQLVRMAEQAVAQATDATRGEYQSTLGAALFRAGEFGAARETLRAAHSQQGDGGRVEDWFILAMLEWQSGHHAVARDWFERAIRRTQALARKPEGTPRDAWPFHLSRAILYREAAAIVDGPTL